MPTLTGYYAARDFCKAPYCPGMSCSDNNGFTAAWPYLESAYPPYDDEDSITRCVPSFPRLSCGATVTVKNVDPRSMGFGRTRTFKIVQSGPGNACSAPTPGGKPLAIDLNAVGADELAPDFAYYGYIAVEITY